MSKTFIELLDDIQELHEQLADKIFNEVVCKGDSWVPCSERLPKPKEDVLISARYEDSCGDICEVVFSGHLNFDGSYWLATYEEWDYTLEEVLAWQPLPKPYEAEEDKEIWIS